MTKSLLLAGSVAAAALCAPSASAVSPVPSDGEIVNYAIIAQDLSDFHGGVYASSATRNVQKHGWESEFRANRVNAYLGYDLFRWFTVYALGGVVNGKDEPAGLQAETCAMWGFGAWASLLDDDQLDMMWTWDRYRLNAGVEYSAADVCDQGYSEFNAFLTFSLVNEMFLDEGGMYPSSIAVFAGPVYSNIDMDDFCQVSDNLWGFTAGLSFTFSRHVYATVGYDWFSDDSIVYGSAGFRF